MKTTLNLLLALFLLCRSGHAQGFVNLDFESAKIIPDPDSLYYPYGIVTTNALPGWTAFEDTYQLTSISYNAPAVGSTWVSLIATNVASWSPLSGKFSVLLQGGFYNFTPPTAGISQTGLVPLAARSLLFQAKPGPGALEVSLGGQDLNFFALSAGADYTLYGADISAYAGQTESLSVFALQDLAAYNGWEIDNIQFSSTAVPEPSELALAAFSALFLVSRCWKNTAARKT